MFLNHPISSSSTHEQKNLPFVSRIIARRLKNDGNDAMNIQFHGFAKKCCIGNQNCERERERDVSTRVMQKLIIFLYAGAKKSLKPNDTNLKKKKKLLFQI